MKPAVQPSLRQVVQVNVRLSEGGASAVARAIADGLRSRSILSPFVYGYAHRGLRSPLHGEYNSLKLTPAPVAYLNKLSHANNGQESRLKSASTWRTFQFMVDNSDVVHLHAIHSYFTNPYEMLDILAKAGKPVVWTQHDQWILTGRCALPNSCRRWEKGCYSCPDLAAYPPARVDHASPVWKLKREAIARLSDKVPLALVSCADWLAEEMNNAGFSDVHVIRNAADPGFYHAAQESAVARTGPVRLLFIARDLRDTYKVDWEFLERVARRAPGRLTVVGDNPPRQIEGVRLVPAISKRGELAKVMKQNDRLIYTSTNETMPLTIVEALTAGMEVMAVDSRASHEFRAYPQMKVYASSMGMLEDLLETEKSKHVPPVEFEPKFMLDSYMNLYRKLIR